MGLYFKKADRMKKFSGSLMGYCPPGELDHRTNKGETKEVFKGHGN